MSVTIECTIEVSMRRLRAALTAVVPHAEPTKNGDDPSPLSRVRIVLGRSELQFMAASSPTAALAAVGIESDSRRERFAVDDGPMVIDVEPGIVRKLLQQFKAPKSDANGTDPIAVLTVGSDGFWDIQDQDGLIPGMEARYPYLESTDRFPDVAAMIGRALAEASSSPARRNLVADEKTLRLFAHAPAAYGRLLTCEPLGEQRRGWVVWCGPSFIGLLSSDTGGEDSLGRRDADRHMHMVRFGLAEADQDLIDLARQELGATSDEDDEDEIDEDE